MCRDCVSLWQLFLSGMCSSDWFLIFVMSGIKSLVCKMSMPRKYTYLGQFMARRKYDILNVLLWSTNHSTLGCGDYAPPSTIKAKSIILVLPFVSWERLAVPSIFRLQSVGTIYHHHTYIFYIIIGLSSPEGLAVDWVSRTLYFTDSALDRIEVSDLDGNYRKVLISDNLTNPRSIVLEPSAG